MNLFALCAELDSLLRLRDFSADCSNNGLQLEGKPEVHRVAFAVDACYETAERAVSAGADLLFVHHGMSWGSEPRVWTGATAQTMRFMFEHGLSLYAAHLPLDAHPELGNNVQLGQLIAPNAPHSPCCSYCGILIGSLWENSDRLSVAEISALCRRQLGGDPRVFGDEALAAPQMVIVSGGGGLDLISAAVECGAKLAITGEMTHVMYHPARENGVTVLALGHYASEKTGPLAVMDYVNRQFGLPTVFIDCPTGL